MSPRARRCDQYRSSGWGELSDEELVQFRKIALKAAEKISREDQVFEGAANQALTALIEELDNIDIQEIVDAELQKPAPAAVDPES